MAKPTDEELLAAVAAARRVLERGDDATGIARCLVWLHDRNLHLEQVYEAAERYLHSGLAEPEHARLLRALEATRDAERREAHRDAEDTFGLG